MARHLPHTYSPHTEAHTALTLTRVRAQEREEAEALFEPAEVFCLDDAERMWVTPGDKYSVTLTLPPPFLAFRLTQTRVLNWELEPFVFYAVRTVRAMCVMYCVCARMCV